MDQARQAAATNLLGAGGRLLVAERDANALQAIAAALSRAGHQVVTCRNADEVREKLRGDVFDLVLTALDLPGADGMELFQEIRKQPQTQTIPYLILTGDRSPTTRISALKMGVDDYLIKPCVKEELLAKVAAILRRARTGGLAPAQDKEQESAFSGRLSAISIEEVLQFLEMGRKTGLLQVTSPRAVGRLYFMQGQIHSASFADIEGVESIFLLFALKEGRFDFRQGIEATGERTVHANCTSLLLEGLRLMDDTKRVIKEVSEERTRRSARLKTIKHDTDVALKPLSPMPSSKQGSAAKRPSTQRLQPASQRQTTVMQRTIKSPGASGAGKSKPPAAQAPIQVRPAPPTPPSGGSGQRPARPPAAAPRRDARTRQVRPRPSGDDDKGAAPPRPPRRK